MINKIIDGICLSISEEFLDGYKIYTESVEQGFLEPCFSIECVNHTKKIFLGNRYFRENKFMIKYFSSSDDYKQDINEVSEKLYNCLEYIEVDGDLLRSSSKSFEVKDEVLCFSLNFNLFSLEKEEVQKMGNVLVRGV